MTEELLASSPGKGAADLVPVPAQVHAWMADEAKLVDMLRGHRALQRTERACDRWQDRGLLFTTKIGTPIEPRNFNRHFDQLCERAGVHRIRVHDLCHSCATLLYDQVVPLERIQDVQGHSSPTITKSIYVEVTRRVQQDAVDRLGFLFDA